MKKMTAFVAMLLSASPFGACMAGQKSTDAIIHDSLVEVTAEMNKTLPAMVDEETRLDRVGVYGKTFYGRYTLINFAAEELGHAEIQSMHDELKALHVNSYCTNPGLEMFRRNNSGRELDVYDKNAKWITKVAITPADCK